ncbi:MAG: DUF433 domain-containing protein [Pseudomonadota bacterium]
MNTKNVISCNPAVMSGTPVFAGTRVPIKTLFDNIGAGLSGNEFLQDFPSVTREQMIQVLDMADEALYNRTKI